MKPDPSMAMFIISCGLLVYVILKNSDFKFLKLKSVASGVAYFCLLVEEENEIEQHGNGNIGRNKPDVCPLVHAFYCVVIRGEARKPGSNKHAHAIGCKGEQSLRSVFDFFSGFLFRIHIARHKEEI